MVDASTYIRRGHPISFGVLVLVSLIVAIIASALTHDYRQGNRAANETAQGLKDKVHFHVFIGWFSFLFSSIYLGCFLAGVGGILTSIASHLIFLFVNWIFWVAAAGSITAQLNGGQNCGTSPLYYCNSLEALMAFDWIAFILVTIMLGVTIFIGAGAFRRGRSMKDEIA
ncbi:hypothetical protein K437DRAFT_239573 [Tilletiaria anomala UBC 951]|uniref:MARVEL domain-containing protein n=1 Tax=Tilletiaria anomala (strain ATCC 24038 / CBS 436.72 / UBC 951) TaxID=1037660 RepID=A0A066VL82_TILAU|nr:uncharacterized protein K437DRAFT_239573 [Tilletiaria anomala UBC 951]KDN39315.1 hypothetical protein K437DRAFT_239573 [Tilletiaria anomala UBC 951]